MTVMEANLNSFDLDERLAALRSVAGDLSGSPVEAVNTHLHTFFSFNAEGWSPSRVAYEAKRRGLEVAASVDFNVLDAMDEFYRAGQILDLRTFSSLESRTFVNQMSQVEINSPGEPGVAYHMGCCFTRLPESGTEAHTTLEQMRSGARERNVALFERLLPVLAGLDLDYVRDVESLTPGGNATERHILAAFDRRAREVYPDTSSLAQFWSGVLGLEVDQVSALLDNTQKLHNTIRQKLMKRGGIGYVQPDGSTFPAVEKMIAMVRACGAVPCWAWLDGCSEGEADAEGLCDFAMGLGCEALSIIPDRNWNIADAELKAKKVKNFDAIVEAASRRGMLITVGTEMNSPGQPFTDNFEVPEMKKHARIFRENAYALYGYSKMQREQGVRELPECSDRIKRNAELARYGGFSG